MRREEEYAMLDTQIADLKADKAQLEYALAAVNKSAKSSELQNQELDIQLRAIREYLGRVCDRASADLDKTNPELRIAAQLGARLRLAQEIAQKMDAGDFTGSRKDECEHEWVDTRNMVSGIVYCRKCPATK